MVTVYTAGSLWQMRNYNGMTGWLPTYGLKWSIPHHNRFTALFPGPPGWAGATRKLLDFIVQGKIYRGRHTDHPAGRHSIRTNQCPPPPSPLGFQVWSAPQ